MRRRPALQAIEGSCGARAQVATVHGRGFWSQVATTVAGKAGLCHPDPAGPLQGLVLCVGDEDSTVWGGTGRFRTVDGD